MRTLQFLLVVVLTCLGMRAASPLALTAQIVDSGSMKGRKAVVVVAELRNPTQSDVRIVMMTCSWWHNFVIGPSPRLCVPGEICTGNFPYEYILRPGDGYMFVFPVIAFEKEDIIAGEELRVGFSMTPVYETGAQPEVLWSSPMTIPSIKEKAVTNTYARAPLPNKALVPTPMSATPAAGAPVAPATGAAHL
jgi:hypothetical protein